MLWDDHPEEKISAGQAAARALLERINPFLSSRVLRSFLEAYLVVASCLERLPVDEEKEIAFDSGSFLKTCQAVGKQFLLQKRILHRESVSQMHFDNGLKLAVNRGLLEAGAPDLKERREGFAAELREIVRRLDAIDGLAASRRAGLLN
jgi:glycerol-3-phosphate O-acyltransferase